MPVLTVDSLTWLILCWCSGLTSTANLMPQREHTVTCKNMEKTGFAIIFTPTLTYQCQTWTLTKPQERKITTCGVRCLGKNINVIRERVGTTPIHHVIQQQRTRWFGHVVRMLVGPTTKRYLDIRPEAAPEKTWIEGVKETLTSHGISPLRASRPAVDHQLFLPTTPLRVQVDG